MEITITEKVEHKVNIGTKQSAKITLNFLEEEFGITPHMWIENDRLMHEVEYHTSHSWFDDEEIRKATKEDKFILKTVKEIYSRIYDV